MTANPHSQRQPLGQVGVTGDLDEAWEKALTWLQRQMDRRTFDHLLRGSRLVEAHDGLWTVAVAGPQACEWLSHRLAPSIERTISYIAGQTIHLDYVVASTEPGEPAPTNGPTSPAVSPPAPTAHPNPPSPLLSFDPNGAEGGGFWKMGHYATWFWAPLLGAAAWRVYELVVSGDRRRDKTAWTPPRRYSISELARAVAGGRDGRANRDQIRGRYRTVGGQRLWQPGAFDRLTAEGLARIEWHDGTRGGSGLLWQPWVPGGAADRGCSKPRRCAQRRCTQRLVYRLSVVTTLPLLTPQQVTRLTEEQQVAHERYLLDRSLDLLAWEQLTSPTLCDAGLAAGNEDPLDKSVITAAMRQSLPPASQ